jgi:outer membrane protein OmpA-like peptidoglycan-associated protein
MIELLVTFGIAVQPPQASQPSGAFIICPGDRRCPRNSAPAPTPTPVPEIIDCSDGSQVPVGQRCAAAAPMAPGPFIVYFGSGQATLTARAQQILDEVASVIQRSPARVTLAGHTDRRGSNIYNVELSQRYANAVRDYLMARGVRADAITVQAYGEARPVVRTGDGVREPQNRRVEITLTPGGG